MASQTRKEREEIARKRIASILGRSAVAGMRTLEQKISDAGPNNQRVQPHILTAARNQMTKSGQLVRLDDGSGSWYHLADEKPDRVQQRLALLRPIVKKFGQQKFTTRMGQTLEIACYRALSEAEDLRPLGAFRDLNDHGDGKMYSKEEPPSTIGKRSIGNESLDFIAFAGGIPFGIEVKNIREWLYPDRDEVKDAIRKSLALNLVPVIVARRIPYVTYRLLTGLGVVLHQTYNQRMPEADADLAAQVRDKELLGYHDVRVGNAADDRLIHFFKNNLPSLADQSLSKLKAGQDLLEPFASGEMPYKEFAARVRRREQGVKEDNDWPEPEDDPNDGK